MSNPTGDNEIRRMLSAYMPGSIKNIQGHPFTRVCLQLFGMAGHGKSSLINTSLCVMKDEEYFNWANAGSAPQPITVDRKMYDLQDTVYITDNRGMYKLQEVEVLEVAAQFCQLRSPGRVHWENRIERTIDQALKIFNSTTPEILVPIFVYSAKYTGTESKIGEIYPFIKEAHDITGIFPIIVITNYKTYDPKDLENTFKRLGANYVFSIENYTTMKSERNTETDAKILNFLHTCLKEADRGIEMSTGKDLQDEYLKQIMDLFFKEINLKDRQIEKLKKELDAKCREIDELKKKCVIS